MVAGVRGRRRADPAGPSLLLEPLAVGAAARGRVNEWAAPGLTNPLVLVVVLMAVVVLVRSVRHLRASLPELLIAAAGVALATTAVRTIAFGAVLVVPALAAAFAPRGAGGQLGNACRRGRSSSPVHCCSSSPASSWRAPSSGPLPASVDAAVAQLPTGSVVAVEPAVLGLGALGPPDVRPLRDLRAEVYSAPVREAYESFYRAEPGWQSYAAAHDVAALVLVDGSPLDRAVRLGRRLAAGGPRRATTSSGSARADAAGSACGSARRSRRPCAQLDPATARR